MKIFNIESQPTTKGAIQWSDVMITILRENYEDMIDKELGAIIGVPALAIKQKMNELQLARARPARLPKRKIIKVSREKVWNEREIEKEVLKKKKEQDNKRRLDREKEMLINRKKREEAKLQTRQQDFSRMQTVKIDHKTWVYVKPGDDIEKLKKKYHRELSKDGLSKIDW